MNACKNVGFHLCLSRVRHQYLLVLISEIRQQPAEKRGCRKGPGKLGGHKSRCILKPDSRKRIGECARERDRWISEGSRSSEPICSCNVGGHRKGDHVGAGFRTSPNHGHQSKGRYKFTVELASAMPLVLRE